MSDIKVIGALKNLLLWCDILLDNSLKSVKLRSVCLLCRKKAIPLHRFSENRGVAQLVRVHVWGARGRQFESAHPD